MRHRATASFRKLYDELPKSVQAAADKSYGLLKQNPKHPSLRFKNLHGDLWSARVSRGWRALALKEEEGFSWIWIGPHGDYDRLIR